MKTLSINRITFAAIALFVRAPWPKGQMIGHAMIAGVLMNGVYLGPVYWAVAHGMPSGVAALIIGIQPLLTAFFAAGLLRENISTRHWCGLAIGIIGVVLVVSPKLSLESLMGITPATTAATLLGAIGISLGTVYQKKFGGSLHVASGGVWQYVVGYALAL